MTPAIADRSEGPPFFSIFHFFIVFSFFSFSHFFHCFSFFHFFIFFIFNVRRFQRHRGARSLFWRLVAQKAISVKTGVFLRFVVSHRRNMSGQGILVVANGASFGTNKRPRRTSTSSQAKLQPGMSVPAQLQPLEKLTILSAPGKPTASARGVPPTKVLSCHSSHRSPGLCRLPSALGAGSPSAPSLPSTRSSSPERECVLAFCGKKKRTEWK